MIGYVPDPPPDHLAEISLSPSSYLFYQPATALQTALFFQSQYQLLQHNPNPEEEPQ
jgi:hypothetical protein